MAIVARSSVCACLMAAWMAAGLSAAGAQAPSSTPSPLTIQATCVAQGQNLILRVQVANTSTQPAAVVLGFTAADGSTRVVDSISTTTIRVVTGAEEIHVYVNPQYALATGSPWIVSLAPGATHDLSLPVDDFISTMNYARLDPGAVGGARLVLDARPAGKSSTKVWTGQIDTKVGACPQ